MLILSFLILIAGLVLLIKGADWLVNGGSALANRIGVSQLVIGLTIVSFGTSAPELLVNLIASFQGNTDLAISNIVGSNIANIMLILGATAIVTPLVVQKSTVFKEIPFSLLGAITLLVAANDALLDGRLFSALDRADGVIFLGFFIIFLYYTFGIRHHKGDHDEETQNEKPVAQKPVFHSVLLLIAGCAGLAAGGHFTVASASDIALSLGMSEALIGLTLVAIGTSLPELVTSVTAALKKNADIAVGNIIGSNIFNIFWILGISATIKPLPFAPYMNTDLLMVVVATILIFIFIHTGKVPMTFIQRLFGKRHLNGFIISRNEGFILLTLYIGYIGYIAWRG